GLADPSGLAPECRRCIVKIRYRPVAGFGNHAYFEMRVEINGNMRDPTYIEGGPQRDSPFNWGYVGPRRYDIHPSWARTIYNGGPTEPECAKHDCIRDTGPDWYITFPYWPLSGPNSNTWARTLAQECGINSFRWPRIDDLLPGWDWNPPRPRE